jgi:hypothetical protein
MKLPIKINKTLFVVVTGIAVNLVSTLQPELLPFFNGVVEFLANSSLITLAGIMNSPVQRA